MDTEMWADIPGYEGWYQVSTWGVVRSVDRTIFYEDGRIQKHRGKTMSTSSKGKNKYAVVGLCKNRKTRFEYVHRLVAMTFIPNTENKREVNHKDGNKRNNRLTNLEWTSSSENKRHAVAAGVLFNPRPKRGREAGGKLTDDAVRFIRAESGKRSTRELARLFGVCRRTIVSVIRGNTWGHVT